jgi:hypothetical protein
MAFRFSPCDPCCGASADPCGPGSYCKIPGVDLKLTLSDGTGWATCLNGTELQLAVILSERNWAVNLVPSLCDPLLGGASPPMYLNAAVNTYDLNGDVPTGPLDCYQYDLVFFPTYYCLFAYPETIEDSSGLWRPTLADCAALNRYWDLDLCAGCDPNCLATPSNGTIRATLSFW